MSVENRLHAWSHRRFVQKPVASFELLDRPSRSLVPLAGGAQSGLAMESPAAQEVMRRDKSKRRMQSAEAAYNVLNLPKAAGEYGIITINIMRKLFYFFYAALQFVLFNVSSF